jgi:glycosyltransferase involved in cell wall biosynthesis
LKVDGTPSSPRLAVLGTRGIPAAYGGFETFAEELSAKLVDAGVDVTVYCEGHAAEAKPRDYRGIQLEYVPVMRCGPLTTILFDMRCIWRARKRYDVIYVLGYGAAYFTFVPRLYGVTVWLNVDGIEWRRAKWGRLAKLYFKMMEALSCWMPDRLIADAFAIREHLHMRHNHVPPCSVIAYGASVVERAPPASSVIQLGLMPSQYYLLVCRLEPENHVREIIEGFAASKSSYPLIVVGNHLARNRYVRELLGFESPRVRFIGAVYDKERLETLRYHSLAYFHGHSVGGTNPSLLEAMGCGNLVVAHDNPFNREVLGPGHSWFFLTAADVAGAVESIEGLGAAAMALAQKRVRERVRAMYSWDHITSAYLELLRGNMGFNSWTEQSSSSATEDQSRAPKN